MLAISDTLAVKAYFAQLGLAPEIADIYLALFAYASQNIFELGRNPVVERTRLYRLIETLKDTNLIEVETQYKRSVFTAAPIGNLQILISKKEQELLLLQAELSRIEH